MTFSIGLQCRRHQTGFTGGSRSRYFSLRKSSLLIAAWRLSACLDPGQWQPSFWDPFPPGWRGLWSGNAASPYHRCVWLGGQGHHKLPEKGPFRALRSFGTPAQRTGSPKIVQRKAEDCGGTRKSSAPRAPLALLTQERPAPRKSRLGGLRHQRLDCKIADSRFTYLLPDESRTL